MTLPSFVKKKKNDIAFFNELAKRGSYIQKFNHIETQSEKRGGFPFSFDLIFYFNKKREIGDY